MIAITIDPAEQSINLISLSAKRHLAVKACKKLLGEGTIAQQQCLSGFDLLLVNADNIFKQGKLAFSYKNTIVVFGRAVLIGYDTDSKRIINIETTVFDLKDKIKFLNYSETAAISTRQRNQLYSALLHGK